MGGTRVAFGEDVRGGCMLRLNETELEALCAGEGAHAGEPKDGPKTAGGVGASAPAYLNVTDRLVGMLGNADPLDASQWLEIVESPWALNAPAWSSADRTCSKLVTSLNYRFLWAYVGTHANPQAKIVSARVDWGAEDVSYLREDGAPQALTLSTTVSFVQYIANGYKPYRPPNPPVAVTVPYDVWYPFEVDSGRSGARASAAGGAGWRAAALTALAAAALVRQAGW